MSAIAAQASLAGASVRRVLVERPLVTLTIVLALLVVAAEVISPGYIGSDQLGTILRLAAPLAVLAAGQTLVMLTGGIDLSVANTATAAAYVTAAQGSEGTAIAILAGLAVGAVIGLLNGIGVGVFRVHPLIMTLGMAGIIIGLLTVEGRSLISGVSTVPDPIRDLATTELIGNIPANLAVWAPVAVVMVLGLRYSGFGRTLYALGDNPIATRLAGVRSWQVLAITYTLCGILAAIAGMLILGFTDAASLELADTYLLPSVAAVVIGGTSIFGGIGGYGGTILGALVLTVLASILTLLEAAEAVKQILYGLIILGLAALYAYTTRQS